MFEDYLDAFSGLIGSYTVEKSSDVQDVEADEYKGFPEVNNMLLSVAKDRCMCGRWKILHMGSCVIVYDSGDAVVYGSDMWQGCWAGLVYNTVFLHTIASENVVGIAKYYEPVVHVFTRDAEAAFSSVKRLRESGLEAHAVFIERPEDLHKWFGFMRRYRILLNDFPRACMC
jgi:hypothetical protein